jgi:isopenicillin N synthase-like dioxygenase
MRSLSQSLGLNGDEALEQSHRVGEISTSAVGILKYPPASSAERDKLGQIAHTDVGSITLLFSHLGGLQVLDSETNSWGYIQPKAGHAVVNVGDSLRFLSGSHLSSSLHRVVPHPDAETLARYSIAYFMRPEEEARFTDDEGRKWTGIGWHSRKFKVFRAPLEEQKMNSVLTGKKGYLGLWDGLKSGEKWP